MSSRFQRIRRRWSVWRTVTALLIVVLTFPYAAAPVFTVMPTSSFTGTTWFDPYANSFGQWYTANVHLHSHSWWGTTDGRQNSPQQIDSVYRKLGYSIVALSNYQRIDSLGYRWRHLPCYEHGYNIQKTHQLALGARSVVWLDCILPQTLFVKQWILDVLRPTAEVIVLAHPAFGRPSYRPSDLAVLAGYDCIEVFNHYRTSLAHWDSALSNGIVAWAVGNDDCHDVSSDGETGVCLTLVQLPSDWQPHDLYDAYRRGRTIAVRTRRALLPLGTPRQRLSGDSLVVELDRAADSIRFIADRGHIIAIERNTSRAGCSTQPRMHYLRAEVYSGETIYALNPIVRAEKSSIIQNRRLIEDVPATLLYRLVWALIYANIAVSLRRKVA